MKKQQGLPNPPRIVSWLIRLMFPDRGGSSTLGDMIETYRSLAADRSPLRARLWFWTQCVKSIPYFVTDELYWRISMFGNYLKIAFRNMRKNRTHSFLNIVGLTVGLAVFILIILYVQHELSFDRFHENADRMYRVVRDTRSFTPPPLGPALKEKLPEVEAAARLIRSTSFVVSYGQEHFLEAEFFWADPEMFKIFSIPFMEGDPVTALEDPSSILLSQKAAEKYFGDEDPIGKVLVVNSQNNFVVSGVFENMPSNSHFRMDVVVPYMTYFRVYNNDVTSWMSNYCYTYALLREGTDAEAFDSKIHPVIERPLYLQAGMKEPFPSMYQIQPVTAIHLHSHREQEISVNNDIKYVWLFTSIAFLILFIACVNYMNLATARSIRRGREVGMRKVVGARRGQLVLQFLGESLATAFLAMGLSLVLVKFVLPAFNHLVERELTFNPMANPQLFIGLVAIVIFVGLFAGSYPALSVSGFKPIMVLSRSFTHSRKGSALRNVLVLVQFSISIFLIVCTLTVQSQLRFVNQADMGYSREQIITLPVRDSSIRRNIEAIKTELLRNPGILAVTAAHRLPNDIDNFTSRDWTGQNPDEPITIYYNMADSDYVDLFGLEIVEGRNFSKEFSSDPGGAFLVNETAVKVAEWDTVIGRKMSHLDRQAGTIVGILKDFHLHSLHRPIEPLYVFYNPGSFSNIAIKISTADIPSTLAYAESVMKRFSPSFPFAYSFFDEVFERAYLTEQRMGDIFSSFAVLAIIIACLGLFGLAAFAAEQRTKEIGIRKVLGASVSKIVLLLSREFVRWVVLANLIAWPVAFFAMNRWLQNFAYRTHMGVVVFLVSGCAALLIATLTVSFQAVKSAQADPVGSLRHE
ncbi:ABC transporter permease [Acidobacteriota bacterium]